MDSPLRPSRTFQPPPRALSELVRRRPGRHPGPETATGLTAAEQTRPHAVCQREATHMRVRHRRTSEGRTGEAAVWLRAGFVRQEGGEVLTQEVSPRQASVAAGRKREEKTAPWKVSIHHLPVVVGKHAGGRGRRPMARLLRRRRGLPSGRANRPWPRRCESTINWWIFSAAGPGGPACPSFIPPPPALAFIAEQTLGGHSTAITLSAGSRGGGGPRRALRDQREGDPSPEVARGWSGF